MTNAFGICKQFTVLMLFASLATAQQAPPLPAEIVEPGAVLDSGDTFVPGAEYGDPSLELWDHCPAPPESSGTWIRRGWWYANVDGVAMIRRWNHDSRNLAADLTTTRGMSIRRTSPAEGSARLSLGRFLFRDIENRDHTLEFSVFGGNEFFHACDLTADQQNGLVVPFQIDRGAVNSFDGANSMNVEYASRFNSFEWNYKVQSRMKCDRMELQPNGSWIRRASEGYTYHGLAGIRYIDLSESIQWTATDILNGNVAALDGDEDGTYLGEVSNDLFGFQAGGGLTYESHRWSLTAFGRGGIFMNDAKGSSTLRFTDGVTGAEIAGIGSTSNDRQGSLPIVISAGLTARYHLRPNLSLKVGYELFYLTAVALAIDELDFQPDDGKLTATANPFYHGISMGADFYW